MKTEPPIREDGGCAQCGKERKPAKGLSGQTGQLAHIFAAAVAADPFCSANCCRAYYGTVDKSPTTSADPMEKPMPQCGTTAAYASGCRCDACRGAEAASQRERRKAAGDEFRKKERERMRRRKTQPVTNHSAGGYRLGCRCDVCKAANTKYARAWRKRQIEEAA